jgi:entericidin B
MMKRLVALFMLLTMGMLAGCNTVDGMGRDIERGGEKIQDGSRNVKERM